MEDADVDDKGLPKAGAGKKIARVGLNVASSIPFVGGILSAAAGAWSEAEQDAVNKVFQQWIQMLEDELRDKAQTIVEIMARVDIQDERIKARIESDEYQALLKKAFHSWAKIDSEAKRQKIRNLLSNTAVTSVSSDDVVKLFIDWLNTYSDFHFEVIGEIYRSGQITRGEIWRNLGRPDVREDSADADLYKLLISDLSIGRIIRQERQTDYYGNFVKKPTTKKRNVGVRDNKMKSAFDDEDYYVLTDLGQQFVHYAMNELVPRIEFKEEVA